MIFHHNLFNVYKTWRISLAKTRSWAQSDSWMDKGSANTSARGMFYLYLVTDVMDLFWFYIYDEWRGNILNALGPGGLKQSDWSDMKCKMGNYGFVYAGEQLSSLHYRPFPAHSLLRSAHVFESHRKKGPNVTQTQMEHNTRSWNNRFQEELSLFSFCTELYYLFYFLSLQPPGLIFAAKGNIWDSKTHTMILLYLTLKSPFPLLTSKSRSPSSMLITQFLDNIAEEGSRQEEEGKASDFLK